MSTKRIDKNAKGAHKIGKLSKAWKDQKMTKFGPKSGRWRENNFFQSKCKIFDLRDFFRVFPDFYQNKWQTVKKESKNQQLWARWGGLEGVTVEVIFEASLIPLTDIIPIATITHDTHRHITHVATLFNSLTLITLENSVDKKKFNANHFRDIPAPEETQPNFEDQEVCEWR